jgi:Sec7-like guanine-nucleotide exchange factor
MPTEGQIVERILITFSHDYYERTSGSDNTFLNEDAVITLVLSIALLNVDQHSPQITTDRMSLVRFFEKQIIKRKKDPSSKR